MKEETTVFSDKPAFADHHTPEVVGFLVCQSGGSQS
jgi:hypothetical protein